MSIGALSPLVSLVPPSVSLCSLRVEPFVSLGQIPPMTVVQVYLLRELCRTFEYPLLCGPFLFICPMKTSVTYFGRVYPKILHMGSLPRNYFSSNLEPIFTINGECLSLQHNSRQVIME